MIVVLITVKFGFATVYTTDKCMDGTATSSSTFSVSYVGANAFNDLINNYGWYTTNNVTSGWLEYEFVSPRTIKKYQIFTRPLECNSAPKDWTFEAWDGAQWVILDTQTGITDWTTNDSKGYEILNDIPYLRYRICITANNGTTYTGIEEMEMYEEAVYIGGEGPESVWHFGFGASLDFRYDPPLAGIESIMDQWEGCSSISDDNGDILFYTNGVTVWNATNSVMPNGSGLYGSNSSTQSSIVVPKPESTTEYYIFTLERDGHHYADCKGFCYSIVDMTLNGGLGDVVSGQKNVEINNPHTEKITAINHSNGTDIWILTHDWGNNDFLAYLMLSTGLNTTPVTSSVGIVHYDNSTGWNSAGYMKASPGGTKVAVNVLGAQTTQVFDFDASTGIVSNAITLSTSRHQAYGLEFSPDGTKLYTTAWEHNNILQYNLSLGDEASIVASEIEIGISAVSGGSNYSGLGAMQVAPDGNIYVAKDANGIGGDVNSLNGWLGVISNPNDAYTAAKAGATYIDKGVYLGGKASGIGLPTYIQTYFKPLPVTLVLFNAVCEGKEVNISWETASEINNDYFILEKSNGKDAFYEIARVDGAGNSNSMKEYSYVDESKGDETSYYRLRQIDFDGKETVYKMISITCNNIIDEKNVLAYPNPFDNYLTVDINGFKDEGFELLVIDNYGRVVYSERYYSDNSNFSAVLKLEYLNPAVYNLQIISKNIVLSTKVLKK